MTQSQLNVANDHVVSFHYRLTNDSGELLDESGDSPLEYLHGHGNIVPGLERALTGKSAGFTQQVVVAPEDGYGVWDERGIRNVPRGAFPPDAELEPGMEFVAQSSDGSHAMLRIKEVGDEAVVIDLNHPLAGVTLHFDVEVVGVRAGTEEELAHGHVHAPGGCGGHGHESGGCCGGKRHDESKDCAEDGSCCRGHGRDDH